MSDHYTEYERTGFLGNMGNSFGNMLFGFIIFLASFVLHWWNEGRAVKRYIALEEGQNNVVETQKFDPKNEDKLVYVSGALEIKTPATDADFNIKHKDAVKVLRRVEMYQWDEKKRTTTKKNLGGSKTKKTTYTYDEIWSDSAINSSSFNSQYRAKYKNPTKEPSQSFYAAGVKLKGYSVNERQVNMLSSMKKLQIPSSAKIPSKMASRAKNLSSYIFISRNGSSSMSSPQVGDYRISFQYLPVSTVSVIGQQSGGGLKEYLTSGGGKLLEVREGEMKSGEIFKKAAEENESLTWILRGVGLLAMTIGLAMCAAPLTALFNVIPFLGSAVGAVAGFFALIVSILLSTITIAVAWFAHRPMLSLAVAGGGALLWLLFRFMQPSKDTAVNAR